MNCKIYFFNTEQSCSPSWSENKIVRGNKGELFSNTILTDPLFKFQRKTGSAPEFAFHINPATHNRHKLFDNGQPNANTIYTVCIKRENGF